MGNLTEKTEAGTRLTRYGYDPLNRRIWKEQYRDKAGSLLNPAKRTLYLYADEGLIGEAEQALNLTPDGSVSAQTGPQITTQYGPRPGAPFGTGLLFVKTKNSSGEDRVAYYHPDHLGTPLQATDKAGRIVWAARYETFGRATLTTPAATAEAPVIVSRLRLPEQYEDEESGLHYNFRRYYDPETGRYIQSDPIGLQGGINTYAYVEGNPVSSTDPEGLYANIAIGVGIRGIGGRALAGAIGVEARKYGPAGMVAACVLAGVCMFQEKTPNEGEPGSCHVTLVVGKNASTGPMAGQRRIWTTIMPTRMNEVGGSLIRTTGSADPMGSGGACSVVPSHLGLKAGLLAQGAAREHSRLRSHSHSS